MKWELYRKKFIAGSISNGFNREQIISFLDYAKKLHLKNLPIIFDINHLSKLVGYDKSYILRAIENTQKFYRSYSIPKKNGNTRRISEPLPSLKEIQKWILIEILEKEKISEYAKAFVKKQSIKSNAKFHRNRSMLLTIDIQDFFGSITQEKIHNIFLGFGYTTELSHILSSLCCLNGVLPQGSPTSPTLSNLIFKELDKEIANYCRLNNILYTRYADDLTFSGDLNPGRLINFVRVALLKEGFLLNPEKTRTRRRHQRQEVTGIVVNQKMQAPKDVRKKFRQSVYYIKKFGFEDHIDFTKQSKNNYLMHLIGVGNFISFITPTNLEVKKDLVFLKSLLREKDN